MASLTLMGMMAAGPAAPPPTPLETGFGFVMVDPRDRQSAIAEGDAAKRAAEHVLGLADVTFLIVDAGYALPERVAGSMHYDPVFRWAFANGPGRPASRPPDHVLRHEIGHGLFVRFVVPSSIGEQYGGDAPDWLDEMAAIAFEGEPQQVSRRQVAAMLARSSRLIPLDRLFDMPHPEFGRSPALPAGAVFRMGPSTSQDTLPFYSTVRAFYDFLVDRTGSVAIVAELGHAYQAGSQLDRWIMMRLDYDDAGDTARLNADFLAWIASDARYDGA